MELGSIFDRSEWGRWSLDYHFNANVVPRLVVCMPILPYAPRSCHCTLPCDIRTWLTTSELDHSPDVACSGFVSQVWPHSEEARVAGIMTPAIDGLIPVQRIIRSFFRLSPRSRPLNGIYSYREIRAAVLTEPQPDNRGVAGAEWVWGASGQFQDAG